MFLDCFACGPFETNTYVIACKETKIAAVIDAAMGSFSLVMEKAKKDHLELKYLFLTHSHWDHMADAYLFQKKLSLSIWVDPKDAPNLEKPGSDKLPLMMAIEGVKADHFFEEGKEISIGNIKMKVIATPGHSPGGVSLYCEKQKILFSGDTLFRGTMGNISFPTSSPKDMWTSLKKLSTLPPDTVVLPGHGPKTTIGEEKWIAKAEELYG